MRLAGAALLAPLLCVACDEGLAPAPFNGIRGHVTFHGALPDSTDQVYVVAFRTFPQSSAGLLDYQRPPDSLELDSAARAGGQPYALSLPDGTYEWVLAVWKKVGNLTLQNADSLLQEAGYYRDPADTTRIGVVTVAGVATDIDFVVDFANMHPVSYYFPPASSRP